MHTELRAAEVDRRHVVDALHRHTVAGRLSLDEFADRVGAAHGAVTRADLAQLTADLPDEPIWRRVPLGRVALVLAAAAVSAIGLVTLVVFAVLLAVGATI